MRQAGNHISRKTTRGESSVTKKCKLLCPHGCGVRQLKETGDPIILDCGHSRGEIIPLKAGRASFENLQSKIGWECFPVTSSHEQPTDEHPLDELDLPDLGEGAIAACIEALDASHEEIEY
jgi:hypothetical protein